MKYEYWIFDMDGTLTDSMGIWDKLPFMVLERYGKKARPDLGQRLVSFGRAEAARLLIGEYGLPLDEKGLEALNYELICQMYHTVTLKPGVQQVLARLKAGGAHLAVCSNTWQPVCEQVLARLGVLGQFDFILSASQGLSKRQPAIFLQAMQRLGCPAPAQCLVCEDALHAARTAHSAGFEIIGIADPYSSAHEPALRALSAQFLQSWHELDWPRFFA